MLYIHISARDSRVIRAMTIHVLCFLLYLLDYSTTTHHKKSDGLHAKAVPAHFAEEIQISNLL